MEAIEAVQVRGDVGSGWRRGSVFVQDTATWHQTPKFLTLLAYSPHLPLQLLEAGGKARWPDLRTRETTLVHHAFSGYTSGRIECLT